MLQSKRLAREYGDSGGERPRTKYVFGVCVCSRPTDANSVDRLNRLRGLEDPAGNGDPGDPQARHLPLQVDLGCEPHMPTEDTGAQGSCTSACPCEPGQELSCSPQSLELQPRFLPLFSHPAQAEHLCWGGRE